MLITCCISHVHESRNDWFKKRNRSRRGDKKSLEKFHYAPFRVGRPLRHNSGGFEINRRCIVFRHATYENEYTLLTIMMRMMMMVVVVVSRWLWRCLLKLWIIVRLEAVSWYRWKICSVLPFDPPKSIYFGKSIIPNLNWPMKVKLHAQWPVLNDLMLTILFV